MPCAASGWWQFASKLALTPAPIFCAAPKSFALGANVQMVWFVPRRGMEPFRMLTGGSPFQRWSLTRPPPPGRTPQTPCRPSDGFSDVRADVWISYTGRKMAPFSTGRQPTLALPSTTPNQPLSLALRSVICSSDIPFWCFRSPRNGQLYLFAGGSIGCSVKELGYSDILIDFVPNFCSMNTGRSLASIIVSDIFNSIFTTPLL